MPLFKKHDLNLKIEDGALTKKQLDVAKATRFYLMLAPAIIVVFLFSFYQTGDYLQLILAAVLFTVFSIKYKGKNKLTLANNSYNLNGHTLTFTGLKSVKDSAVIVLHQNATNPIVVQYIDDVLSQKRPLTKAEYTVLSEMSTMS